MKAEIWLLRCVRPVVCVPQIGSVSGSLSMGTEWGGGGPRQICLMALPFYCFSSLLLVMPPASAMVPAVVLQ